MQIAFKDVRLSRQNLKMIMFFILVVSFSIFAASQFAFADFEDFAHTEFDTITKGVGSVANDVFTQDYYSQITTNGSILAKLVKSFKVFGAAFALGLGLIKMIKEIQKAQDPADCILRYFFELCIAILVILNIDKIINVFDALGALVIKNISGTVKDPSAGATIDDVRDAMGYSDSWWGWISFSIALIIPYAFAWIEGIAARVISYSIVIELGIRRAFIPFAVGDVGIEGLRSHGFRYLKKYLGVYLQEAIVMVTCIVLSTLSVAVMKTTTGGGLKGADIILNLLGVNLAGLMVMFKATSWANDIVGA